MRATLELPRLSLDERHRRWTAVREKMKENDLEGIVLFGFPCHWDFAVSNARYLSGIGGNAETNVLIFPLEGEPTCFVGMPTFVEYWKLGQDWIRDIRAKKGPWADNVASSLKEKGLEGKRIGVDGLAGPLNPDGWVPFSVYKRLLALMAETDFVSTDDMLEGMRAIKSSEEIEFIERAARLGDLMLESCRQTARPGVRECEVYGAMMGAMLGNGGEEPTLFLWASDAHPFPHPFRLPTTRVLEKGDLIICEIHPKCAGYCTHVERTFSLGDPKKEYKRIYQGCLEAYEQGMKLFLPGHKISEAMYGVKKVIDSLNLGICEAGIHGHGVGSLEYPRFRLHALETDAKALAFVGDEFKPGMVFAFNIDLVDPNWKGGSTGCVLAETIMVGEDKPRRLHDFSLDLQVIA